jgi:mono/diheme cytochrome c family protein
MTQKSWRETPITRWPGILLLMALTWMPAVAGAQQGSAVAEGAKVYGNTCGGCHNARSPLERTDRQWVTIINHMRVRGNLTGGQARAVLAFLQATNTDPRERGQLLEQSDTAAGTNGREISSAVSADQQTIALGATLVSEKACLGCHIVGNVGGAVGPSLNGTVSQRGAKFVRQKLIDPTFNSSSSMMPNFGLTDEQIDALVAYLATVNQGI